MKKVLKWVGIIFVILLVIGIASGNKNQPQKIGQTNVASNQETTTDSQSQAEVKTYKVGDIVQSDNHVFVVNNVRKDTGSGFIVPKSGNVYVVVDATIENKSSDKVNISTLLQMYLKDSEGTKFTPTVGAKTTGSLDGEIVGGDKSKGEVTFEVPTTATGLKFYYEAGWITGNTIVVDLGI